MFFWPFNKKRVGLVLGGGVARGIAHIGVLKVLSENKVPIHYLAATSSGSIIAAAYAAGMKVSLIEEIALRIHWGEFMRFTLFRPGFMDLAAIEEFIGKYIGEVKFSELKTPLSIMATDLITGELVVLKEGSVAQAAAISSAFPGFFAPEKVQGRFLAEGGIACNLPVSAVKEMGANFVIAVDVIPSRPIKTLPADAFQVFGRSLDLVFNKLNAEQRKMADILIDPEIAEDIWHLDLHKAKRLIAAGEMAAHRAIAKIKQCLKYPFWLLK